MPSSGYLGFGWKCFMPWTENSSHGEEATMKSKVGNQSPVSSRTFPCRNSHLAGVSGGSTKSMPTHSHPRAAKALLHPQRPQNKSRSLIYFIFLDRLIFT